MLAQLFDGLTKVRNFSYDQQWLKTCNFEVPVVSVGNITVGGTGKTPIVEWIVQWALDSDLRPGIVSRGYKSKVKKPTKVDSEGKGQFCGDEPTMLAKKFPNCPVYVCPDRVLAVESLLAKEDVDFVLADDAFQHRRLGRNIDIVILDLLDKIEDYQLLPAGRARESISSLGRADFLVFNKVNFSIPGAKDGLEALLQKNGVNRKPVLFGDYKVKAIRQIVSGKELTYKEGQSVALVSGIGKPLAFEELIKGEELSIERHFKFKDHYHFGQKDLDSFKRELVALSAEIIICTSKDCIKLEQYCTANDPIFVAELDIELTGETKKLTDEILSLTC